jgi:hypothetical protein
LTLQLSYSVLRKRYGRTSERFERVVGYIGELWGTKKDLGEHCICHGFVMSELILDCLVNSCKPAFGSSISEILSLPSVLL